MRNANRSRRVTIKNKMRLSQSLHCAPRRSTSANRQLCVDLPTSNGRRVFKVGTNAPSSTARIIPRRRAFSRKHGAKFLAISARRSFSRFFPTKICAESAKRSRRSANYVLLPKIRSERAAAARRAGKSLSAITPSLPYSITPSIADALNQARATTASHSSHRLTPFRRRSARASARRTRRLRRMRAVNPINHHEGHGGHEDAFRIGILLRASSCTSWLINSLDPRKQRHRFADDMSVRQSPPLRISE